MTSILDARATPARCDTCGSDIAAGMLACPACRRLVHATALAQLKADAEAAHAAGDHLAELAAWRSAADLLPPGSRQHATVVERLDALTSAGAPAPAAPIPSTGAWKWLATLGTAGSRGSSNSFWWPSLPRESCWCSD